MTSITFYGGINEIGGNKFLLEDQRSRVFLDFGKNFAREKLYFEDPYIMAREEKHLLNLGILPHIKGLYKSDAETYELDGIVISHPHLDHYDALRFIKDDYHIFCGEDAKSVILAREFSSYSIGAEYNIANLTAKKGKEVFKDFKTFKSGDKCKAGDVEFKAYALDHSVPGSYGFIVETEKGCIVYTGDFRMHGIGREKTLRFIEKAKEVEPEVLLIEGTHINECKLENEEEVKEKVGKIVSNTKKLVLAGFAITDIDRMKTFYEVAKEHDRKLAISTKQAYIVDTLCKHEELKMFSPDDPNVLIFQREKKRYGQYEKEIQERYPNIVSSKDISSMQEEVILVASLYDMNEVAEIKPEAGSSYILSQSEPFDEEMEISYEKLLNWLNYLGIPLYQAHASGHATPHELKHAIAEISPKKVVPIHTQTPELFKGFISDLEVEVVIPSEGKRVEL
jgi:ribonuclease J